ncbi:hypothetical protein ACFV2X_55500 [Streptomyces sp. NPDC059679]|uniref:hypothetical protein n=1 Tax=Streptomyces sp. NPDC059679 TaxID=3346903 RepID=UPI00369355F5
MSKQITEPVSFLRWDKDGSLIAPVRFPAGTPRERITAWRELVAAKGGAVTEVYDPTPPISEERMAFLRQKMAAVRAARLARG